MDKTLWPSFSNLPGEKDIAFKFFVDAANQPTLAPAPLNNYITSVVRTSQGLYTITLADSVKTVVNVAPELNLATPSALYAQSGPQTNIGVSTSVGFPTLVIYTLNGSGSVTNPPSADPNLYVSGTITVTDLGAQ